METFLVILIIAAVGYWFFRNNTRRGQRTVRAFVFLATVRAGGSVEEANVRANSDIVMESSNVIRGAKAYADKNYGGKQLPMIAAAESAGLIQGERSFFRDIVAALR